MKLRAESARITAEHKVVRAFLAAQFAGRRHQRRIDEITEMDEERVKG